MEDSNRIEIAESFERLADQSDWNAELWQRCHDLVAAHLDDELLAYIYDEIIHYSGLFDSQNILGFRVQPRLDQIEVYRREFRVVAHAVRTGMTLTEFKKRSGL